MKLLSKITQLNEVLDAARQNGKLGFVPTMGALHAGHKSLVERARKECATVVVSIFVNPTQFNDKNDLKNYPRNLEADAQLLESAGVDFIFAPTVEEIYPTPDTRVFDFQQLDKVMEGASRPGHFNGVGQVVSRLFEIVKPDVAYFGEKDFQQIAIIKEMVKQVNSPVEIIECPIKRGEDGLALSSRNELLDSEHRAAAPHIFSVLNRAGEMKATLSPSELEEWIAKEIDKEPLLKTIYCNIVDGLTMQQVDSWNRECTKQCCVAVQCGNIRLIDNIRL